MLTYFFPFIIWVAQISFVSGQASKSTCRTASGTYVTGAVSCVGGEVFLRGNYVEVGIHKVGSYGTFNGAKTSSATAYVNQRMGFIADFDRNGFNTNSVNSPFCKYAGDYFVPGAPVEGIHIFSF